MYRTAEFADYFMNNIGGTVNSLNNYQYFLRKIDQTLNGLDEKIAIEGISSLRAWAETTREGPFERYASDARSILKCYLRFSESRGAGADGIIRIEPVEAAAAANGTTFRIEREMQAAVRRQLASLEPGLKEADGGLEVSVATGKIDILAEDAQGGLVVIELKAGECPLGALEQTAGYAEALSKERARPVRALLIAATFPDRVRAAARRVRDLELRSYLRFQRILV